MSSIQTRAHWGDGRVLQEGGLRRDCQASPSSWLGVECRTGLKSQCWGAVPAPSVHGGVYLAITDFSTSSTRHGVFTGFDLRSLALLPGLSRRQ